MTSYTRLHVVFAGRGDALIVEQDDPHPRDNTQRIRTLDLVDGGPLYRHPFGGSKFTYGVDFTPVGVADSTSPYFRYLEAAMREVWGSGDPVKVRLILNTHPDDDHYGGLLKMLSRNLGKNHFKLATGFYTPYWRNQSDYNFICRHLQGKGLQPAVAEPTCMANLRLNICYPSIDSLIEFKPRNPGYDKPEPENSVDSTTKQPKDRAKDKNDGSILGTVQDSSRRDAIFITGDGSADRIAELVTMNPPYRVPIYKIQHHGGWLKQHDDWYEYRNFKREYGAECCVFNLLTMSEDLRKPLNIKFSAQDEESMRLLAKFFATKTLPTVLPRNQTAKTLYEKMKERRRSYTDLAMPLGLQGETKFINDTTGALIWRAYQQLAKATEPQFNENTGQYTRNSIEYQKWKPCRLDHFYVMRYKQGKYVQERRDWLDRFFSIPIERDAGELHLIARIQQFYATFKADVYVVSGSSAIHGHPKAPTLMGLAHAVRRQNRRAVLFMTDPGMLFSVELAASVRFSGWTRDELFAGQHLTVHYLSEYTFMSLDAGRNLTLGARDIKKRTEALGTSTNQASTENIVHHLETVVQVLPIDLTSPAGKRWMFTTRTSDDKWWYLKLEAINGSTEYKPVWVKENQAGPASRMLVQETVNMRGDEFWIKVSLTENFAISLKLKMERVDKKSPVRWHMSCNVSRKAMRVGSGSRRVAMVEINSNVDSAPIFATMKTMSARTGGRAGIMVAPKPIISKATSTRMIRQQVADNALSVNPIGLQHVAIETIETGLASTKAEGTEQAVSTTTLTASHLSSPSREGGDSNAGDTAGSREETTTAAEEESVTLLSDSDDLKGEEPSARDTAAGILSLDSYLDRCGFSSGDVINGLQALNSLVGNPDDVKALLQLRPFANVLNLVIDHGNSVVGYETDVDSGLLTFTTANLVSRVPSEQTLPRMQLGEDDYLITGARIELSRTGDHLQVLTSIQTQAGMAARIIKTIKLSPRKTSLRSYLRQAGFATDKLRDVSIAALFYFLLGSSSSVLSLFCDSFPAALLQSQPALMMPDLDRSIMKTAASPLGAPALYDAIIVTKLGSGGTSPVPEIDLSILKLNLTSIHYEICSLGTEAQRVTYVAMAKVMLANGKDGLEVKLSYDMMDCLSEISLAATYCKSLNDLASVLPIEPKAINLAAVPLTKSAQSQSESKKLEELGLSGLGFSIREVGKGSGKFKLASVWLAVAFDDWQDWLPAGLKSNVVQNAATRITVLDPTAADLRRVRVEVSFGITLTLGTLKTETGLEIETRQTIDARLRAQPLRSAASNADYDFRLALSCAAGVSIMDFLRAAKLESEISLASSAPLLGSILDGVKLTHLELGVERSEEQTKISDWSVSLFLENLPIIPGKFSLNSMQTTVSRVADSMLAFEGRGLFAIQGLDDPLVVDFRMPQLEVPGSVQIHTPDGLNLGKFLGFMGLNVSDVPFVSGCAELTLVKANVDFGYVSAGEGSKVGSQPPADNPRQLLEKGDRSLELCGVGAEFKMPEINAAGLIFSNISFEFTWRSRHDMFAHGKDVVEFSARAMLPGRKFAARLSYSSLRGLLGVEVLPIRQNGGTIGDLLEYCVSKEIADKFKPIIGDLELKTAGITVDLMHSAIEGLEIVLDAAQSLDLHTEDAAPVSVRALHISYQRGRTADAAPSKEASPTDDNPSGKDDAQNKGAGIPHKPTQDPTKTLFVVSGVVALNQLRASITFTYVSPSKDSAGHVKVEIASVDEKALSLLNLAELFHLREPRPESPDEAPPFMSISLTKAEGRVEIAASDVKDAQTISEKASPLESNPDPSTPSSIHAAATGKSALRLSSLSITVESQESINILEEPPISLEKLYLKVEYVRTSPSKAITDGAHPPPPTSNEDVKASERSVSSTYAINALIYGSMKVGSQHLDVAYRKDDKLSPNACVFIGYLSSKKGHKVDFKDITDRLLTKKVLDQSSPGSPPKLEPDFDFPGRGRTPAVLDTFDDASALNLPPDIPIVEVSFVFMPGVFVEVSAQGSNPWNGRYADLDFEVEHLGGYLRIEKQRNVATPRDGPQQPLSTAEKKRPWEVTVRLCGKLKIGDFTSATGVLDISPPPREVEEKEGDDKEKKQKKKLGKRQMMARIVRAENSKGDIGSLAGKISSQPPTDPSHNSTPSSALSEWSEHTKGTAPLSFEGEADLMIDFATKRLFVQGRVRDKASGILFAHPHPTKPNGYAFYFALSVDNMHAIWPDLQAAVDDTFEIRRAAVQVLTAKTKTKDLEHDISKALRTVQSGVEFRENGSTKQPGQKKAPELAAPNDPNAHGARMDSPADDEESRKLAGLLQFKLIQDVDLDPAAWFFAEILLDTGRGRSSESETLMSSSLALAADEKANNVSSVMLYGCVSGGKSPTAYAIAVQNLSLAGGLVEIIRGSGQYSSVESAISGKPTRTIVIAAFLRLQHKELSTKALDFEVDMTVLAGATSFVARAGGPNLVEPFKDMFNVELRSLQLSGTFTKKHKNYTLSGQVRLGGGGSDEDLTGTILFQDFLKPRGVLIKYKAGSSVKVGDFTAKYLAAGSSQNSSSSPAVTWPPEYPDFGLESVSVSYVTPGPDFNDGTVALPQGYRLAASVYLFNKPFALSMDVKEARKGGGVDFSATYRGDIDLDIISLTGFSTEGSEKEEGPCVSVKSNGSKGQTTIEARAGVSLLGSKPPMNVTFAYRTTSKDMLGTLFLPEGFLGIPGQQQIGLIYKNGRLSFDKLGLINEFADLIKLYDLIKEGSKAPKCRCEALVGFFLEEGVSGKFVFGLSLPHDDADGADDKTKPGGIMGRHKSLLKNGMIHLEVTWHYDICLVDTVVLSIPFDPFKVKIDPKLKGDGLLSTLKEHARLIIPKLIAQVMQDETTATKLAVIFAVKKSGGEVVNSLLCRGGKDTKYNDAGQDHAEEGAESAETSANEASGGADAAGAAATAGAAGGGVAGGGGATGIGAGLLLIIFGAAVIYKGVKLVKELADRVSANDPERKERMDKARDKAQKSSDKLKTSIDKAINALKQGMVMRAAPQLEISKDDANGTTVTARWAHAVPNLLVSTPEAPQDVEWTVELSNDAEFKDHVITKIVRGATSCEATDTASWPFSPTVFCRASASITLKHKNLTEVFQSAQPSAVASVTHVPFLRPPTSVQLVADGEAGNVTVETGAQRVGVLITVPGEDISVGLLFEREVLRRDMSKPCRVEARLLLSPHRPATDANQHVAYYATRFKTAKAWARNLSDDNSRLQNSGWTLSGEVPIRVGVETLLVSAAMKNESILASWKMSSPQTNTSTPLVRIVDEDLAWHWPANPELTTSGTDKRALLAVPRGFRTNDEVKVAVSDREIPAGSLPVFVAASLTLDLLPKTTINSGDSHLDLQLKQLLLGVTSPFEPLQTSQVVVQLTDRRSGQPVDKPVAAKWRRQGDSFTGVLTVADVRAPIDSTVGVVVQDADSKTKKDSAAWHLHVPKSHLPIPNLAAQLSANREAIVVSWTPLQGVANVYVQVSTSLLRVVPSDRHSISFGRLELGSLDKPGSKFTFSAWASAQWVRGKHAQLEYTVPPLNTPASVTSKDALLQNVHPGFGIAVSRWKEISTVWAVSAQHVITGVRIDSAAKTDTHKPESIVVQDAAASPVAPVSGFAHVRIGAGREDLFWVDTTGAIKARRWIAATSPMSTTSSTTKPQLCEFRTNEDFPFDIPKTARAAAQIPLVAVSHSKKPSLSSSSSSPATDPTPPATVLDLWWVGPAGHLLKASCVTGSNGAADEWSDTSFFVYGEMGPSASNSLVAVRSGPETTDVLWITPAGRVHGVCCRDADDEQDEDNSSGIPDALLYAVGSGAAPASSPAALALDGDGPNDLRVWWIATDGSVVTAVRDQRLLSRWHVGIVAGPESASPASHLAAASIKSPTTAKAEVWVWWAGTGGELVCAKTDAPSDRRARWELYDTLPAHTVNTQVGGGGGGGGGWRGLAASSTAGLGELYYVDPQGGIQVRSLVVH